MSYLLMTSMINILPIIVENLFLTTSSPFRTRLKTMHEFCDGCAAQCKSCHCFGDLSDSLSEFCYQKLIRIFFVTSHAKGPQDAAGGF